MDCSQGIRDILTENLAVVKLGDRCINRESAEAWEKKGGEKKLHRIATKLYDMRSRFTHAGFRQFNPEIPVVSSLSIKGDVLLRREGAPSLCEMLVDTIKDVASNISITTDT